MRRRWVFAAIFATVLTTPACGGEGDIEALYEAGTQLHKKGLSAKAIEKYHAAYDRRGASYQDIGQTNRAFADYNEAIRLENPRTRCFATTGVTSTTRSGGMSGPLRTSTRPSGSTRS